VRLLGNRVDRFEWNGEALEFDQNIIQFRSFQADAEQPLRGNHNGGVLRFGPDRKLYAIVGDTGRRGRLQNLVDGPFGPGIPDDQFGGPEPDDAHRTGVIVRLNADGSAPRDNPFYRVGRSIGGEVGANVQKLFAYGVRNSFGLAFDPRSGELWEQENGDDSYSELNRVESGMNSGWVQIMGPAERVADFKAIETNPTAPQPFTPAGYFGLQQIRWLPTNIADTPEQALSRLFMLPGAQFSDPELSWKYEVGPGGIGFLDSRALGRRYARDLFMGASRDFLEGGTCSASS
jgi:glucose/arabinose dehydrogenase